MIDIRSFIKWVRIETAQSLKCVGEMGNAFIILAVKTLENWLLFDS
jgi:hypothetical protein